MAQGKTQQKSIGRTKPEGAPEAHDNFYEAMPLVGMPHSIYRDDVVEDNYRLEADEVAAAKQNLAMLVSIALAALVVLVFAAVIVYGVSSIDAQTTSASSSSGSLEL